MNKYITNSHTDYCNDLYDILTYNFCIICNASAAEIISFDSCYDTGDFISMTKTKTK